jgi:hypothetical protein
MLFLEAGASVPFGIGDIEDFTREILDKTEGNLRSLKASAEYCNMTI